MKDLNIMTFKETDLQQERLNVLLEVGVAQSATINDLLTIQDYMIRDIHDLKKSNKWLSLALIATNIALAVAVVAWLL